MAWCPSKPGSVQASFDCNGYPEWNCHSLLWYVITKLQMLLTSTASRAKSVPTRHKSLVTFGPKIIINLMKFVDTIPCMDYGHSFSAPFMVPFNIDSFAISMHIKMHHPQLWKEKQDIVFISLQYKLLGDFIVCKQVIIERESSLVVILKVYFTEWRTFPSEINNLWIKMIKHFTVHSPKKLWP